MNFTREFGLLVSSIATGLILFLVPVDDAKVALLRLDHALNLEHTLKADILQRCSSLAGHPGSVEEKFFLDRYAPPRAEGPARPCQVTIEAASYSRFFLRTYSNFLIRVAPDGGRPFFEKNYHVQFPRPLCFFPIALFLLALIFEFKPWGLGCTLGTYLFCLAGGNAIRTTELVVHGTAVTLTADQTFQGLLLILLWLALFLSGRHTTPVSDAKLKPHERALNRAFSGLIGLWNPTVYTLFGRLFAPLRGTVSRLTPFLDAQLFAGALSLYLLSVDLTKPLEFLEGSLLLPRYFSFSAILFLLLTHFTRRPRRRIVISRVPRVWLAFVSVAIFELVALRVHTFHEWPTLTRVGLALLLSELAWPKVELKEAMRLFSRWGGVLFLGSFVAVASQRSGVTDLALALAAPKVHPTMYVFFTFLSGLVLGFLTGNFSTSYFTLLLALKAHDLPQARAALLDGILAGVLLSPFSLFNLLPSAQFGIHVHKLVAFRWRQLAFPFLIGGVIFAVGAINSVAILQPVTFVFLCLVVVAFQLKKRTWTVGGVTALPPYVAKSQS